MSYDSLPWVIILCGLVLLVTSRRFYNMGYGISNAVDMSQLMRMIVSGLVLVSALFIILSGLYGESAEKWAFGAVGTLLGYWLKP